MFTAGHLVVFYPKVFPQYKTYAYQCFPFRKAHIPRKPIQCLYREDLPKAFCLTKNLKMISIRRKSFKVFYAEKAFSNSSMRRLPYPGLLCGDFFIQVLFWERTLTRSSMRRRHYRGLLCGE